MRRVVTSLLALGALAGGLAIASAAPAAASTQVASSVVSSADEPGSVRITNRDF
ncbi:hypothetical protein [Microbispora catharanthi]|uniref:hypothetical protein n=1 Tax=Microbispora catharanthi TaxID=1712871 RepID=UPI001376FFF5|nr:hypothetical protein [Microbispora catharanthi]